MRSDVKKCVIINIGDEVLSGHTVNTNASYISSALYDTGILTRRITVISDDPDEITAELKNAVKDSDIIIMTGGLGPTGDDMTKKTVCGHFGFKLSFRQDIWDHIEAMFARRGITPDGINREQAQFPDSEKAFCLKNETGTAPGIRISDMGKDIFLLPGVPNEMKYLMQEHVIPFLKEIYSGELYYRDVNTTDIPESTLYSILLNDKDYPFGTDIAYLPQGYGVTVRIKSRGGKDGNISADRAAERICGLLKEHVFAQGIVGPFSELVRILKEKRLRISSAESCTGGLFASSLTDVPGSSAVFGEGFVTYSNDSKFSLLSVNPQTLVSRGAVSEETVSEMLDGLLASTSSDIVCAVSGIAGPDGGTEQKPAGTVYSGFCLRSGKSKKIRRYFFSGDRLTVKRKAADKLAVEIIRHLGRPEID